MALWGGWVCPFYFMLLTDLLSTLRITACVSSQGQSTIPRQRNSESRKRRFIQCGHTEKRETELQGAPCLNHPQSHVRSKFKQRAGICTSQQSWSRCGALATDPLLSGFQSHPVRGSGKVLELCEIRSQEPSPLL